MHIPPSATVKLLLGLSTLLLLACTEEADKTLQRPEIHWFSVDLHVHSSLGSNDTDGLGTPDALASKMQELNLDYVALTDHSNAQGSMECADVEDCPNQGPEQTTGNWGDHVWLASEISPRATEENMNNPTGHIGCIPLSTSFSEVTFVDRPFGTVNGGDAIDQCHEVGGWAILNHPFGPTSWVAFDWSSEDFDAIELFNGGAGFDYSDWQALIYWEAYLAERSREDDIDSWLVPIAASDSHRWSTESPGTLLDPALGWPRTWVGVPENASTLTPMDISKGLVYLGDPSTHLRYQIKTPTGSFHPGETLPTDLTQRQLSIEVWTEEIDMLLEVQQISAGSIQTLHTQGLPNSTAPITIEIDLSNEVRGFYYVRVRPETVNIGSRGFFMGNALLLE